MKKFVIYTSVTLAAIAASIPLWLVASSFLFLAFMHLTGQVDAPWMAWWTYHLSDYNDIWTKLYLGFAAAIPGIVLGLTVMIVFRICSFIKVRQTLYGNSAWAENRELQKGGIRRSRTLF